MASEMLLQRVGRSFIPQVFGVVHSLQFTQICLNRRNVDFIAVPFL